MEQTELVRAAQHGDDRAREALVSGSSEMLYNLVGRALGRSADVDDVVQETLLLAVRDLPTLRDPAKFRSWLVAIALHQIGSYRRRLRESADRNGTLDDVLDLAGPGLLEDQVIARLHVSDQRRQVLEAGRWLDPSHRDLMSLWWQEETGRLTRDDVAAATEVGVAHVGVRLQRMRAQLELARDIVAALDAEPRCEELTHLGAGRDGSRSSVWRKRLARHVRACPVCLRAGAGRIPAPGRRRPPRSRGLDDTMCDR